MTESGRAGDGGRVSRQHWPFWVVVGFPVRFGMRGDSERGHARFGKGTPVGDARPRALYGGGSFVVSLPKP